MKDFLEDMMPEIQGMLLGLTVMTVIKPDDFIFWISGYGVAFVLFVLLRLWIYRR